MQSECWKACARINTMNTNGNGLPEGWPDVSELERLANQMFAAKPLSGSDTVASTATGHHGIGAHPEVAPSTLASVSQNARGPAALPLGQPPANGLPYEDEWRALFSNIPLLANPAADPAQLSIQSLSAPSFYFLEGSQLSPGGMQVPGLE